MQKTTAESRYETYASLIAPAAAGCALGILFGRGMRRGPSNVTALALLAAAGAVAAPMIADLIQRAAYRPSSARGSQRRLESIRNGGVPATEMADFFTADAPDPLLMPSN